MIIRKVKVTEYEYQAPINYVAGATEPDIQFQLTDYEIPSGATGRVYVGRSDGTFEYTVATISGNNVTVAPTSSMFSVKGPGAIQVTLYVGNEVVKNFAVPVYVHADLADDSAKAGSDVTGVFRAAEEEALADFAKDAEAKAAEVIESIPADYTELTEEVDELNERIDDVIDVVYQSETAVGEVVVINDSALPNIKSIQTNAQKIYVTGINLWDEEWELGQYSTANGATVYNQNSIRSKNTKPIPIQPETDYYVKVPYNMALMFYDATDTFISYKTGINTKITSPVNAYYLRFYVASNYGNTYNNDIQITFDTDTEKTIYHAHNNTVFNDPDAVVLIPMMKNYIYAIGSSDQIEIAYYKEISSQYIPKKPYQSGFIVFTVPSRLTKSNNSVGAASLSEGSDDSTDVNGILKLPTTYTPNGNPCKLIMLCHGAGQSAESWSSNVNYQALVNAFNSAGYAVFDCNGYRENALGYSFWGDSRGVDVWRKAYQYVVDNYNVEQQFGLYGFSMGGLTALNLMFSGFSGIKCVALGSPVVSLEACYDSESVKAVIKVLYGMGDTYNPALAYGCDPFARMIEINNKKYIFGKIPPIKMWYGSTETGTTDTGSGEVVTGVVVKAYGEMIITAINNAGGQAEYREVANAGHEICYGGNATVNNDLVLYFNRHCL